MPCIRTPVCFLSLCLSAETQLLNDSPVSLDVDSLEVVQQLTTLTDQAEQAAARYHVFLVLLHMLSET